MKEYHIAIVTRNIEKASGITSFEKTSKVSSAALSGSVYFKAETLYDGEYPDPAYPPFGYASLDGAGDFWVPKVGDTILVEIDSSVDLPDPRYLCCLYTNVREIHRDFKKNYPYRLGRVTNSGHKLVYDDTDGEESINLEHTFGQRLLLDKDGSITLEARKVTKRDEKDELKDEFDPDWFKFFVDYTNKTLNMRFQQEDAENFFDFMVDRQNKRTSYRYEYTAGEFCELLIDGNTKETKIHDHHANIIVIGPDGVKVTDKNANIIEMKADTVTVKESGGGTLKLGSNKVGLGGSSAELLDQISQQLEKLSTLFQTVAPHTHIGNLGYPTAPADVMSAWTTAKGDMDTIKGKIDGIKGGI